MPHRGASRPSVSRSPRSSYWSSSSSRYIEPDFRDHGQPARHPGHPVGTRGARAGAAIFPLIAGQFDLSVAAVMGTSSIVAAGVLSKNPRAAVPGGHRNRISGLVVGRPINGWLVTRVTGKLADHHTRHGDDLAWPGRLVFVRADDRQWHTAVV